MVRRASLFIALLAVIVFFGLGRLGEAAGLGATIICMAVIARRKNRWSGIHGRSEAQ